MKQAEVAKEIGVSEDCVTFRENKRSEPQIRHFLKIIEFLAYNPFPVDESTLGGKIHKYRIEHGLSIKLFAKALGIEERTLVSWEKNEVENGNYKFQKLKELIS